jgi:tRNA (mo5U34)-methyltransferase
MGLPAFLSTHGLESPAALNLACSEAQLRFAESRFAGALAPVLASVPGGPAPNVAADGTVVVAPALQHSPHEAVVRQALEALIPWRKGPWNIAGISVDAEWDSRAKWERLAPLLPPVRGKRVLDIGCNNGWYGWHLLADTPSGGASAVVGVDPTALYMAQHALVQHLAPDPRHIVEPIGLAALEGVGPVFDVVLLMGILYHHPDPVQVLRLARSLLAPGGRLVVETIVVAGDDPVAWVPEGRYAGANGFWLLPTNRALRAWLKRSDLRVLTQDTPTPTTPVEQRGTAWRPGASLAEGLDPNDPGRTVEGLPAPLRTIIVAAR